MRFEELNLSKEVLKALKDIGFSEMTEIQQKSIPAVMEGSDVIGRSNTGTGKTAAFGIPAIERIDADTKNVQVLILCPTRELAQQACDEIKKFSKYKRIVKPAAVFGGVSIDNQIRQLKHGANLVIGTPGRIIDHINRHTLKMQYLKMIILDEADEMLQMGFREDIENILLHIPYDRQTILFSATMPPAIMAITKKYQQSPLLIKTISKSNTVETIEQFSYNVSESNKIDALTLLLKFYDYQSSMIFCNTKKRVDELTKLLSDRGFKAVGIHGDLKQAQRMTVMNSFKSGKTSILVATDVAARGIDVSGVDAVFNYDLPQDNEYYVHRIGRTGRAGRLGTAHTLIGSRKQLNELNLIAQYTRSDIKEASLPDRESFIKKKIDVFTSEIENKSSEHISEWTYKVIKRLEENGISQEKLAQLLINDMFSKEIDNIPNVNVIKYKNTEHKNKDSRKNSDQLSMININIGRKQRINPNYILGALVDASGISGKSFGKINILDDHTIVEVPKNKTDHIIRSMNNGKINGRKVIVTHEKSNKKRNYQKSFKKKYDKHLSRTYKKG